LATFQKMAAEFVHAKAAIPTRLWERGDMGQIDLDTEILNTPITEILNIRITEIHTPEMEGLTITLPQSILIQKENMEEKEKGTEVVTEKEKEKGTRVEKGKETPQTERESKQDPKRELIGTSPKRKLMWKSQDSEREIDLEHYR